jgi:hypothetical protein
MVIAKLTFVLFHMVNKCDGTAYSLSRRDGRRDRFRLPSISERIILKCILKETGCNNV